uniref:2-aminoethanethiol dioxygenase n=1 Tax=Graphocephala atropunctata TaxID=36148 RepID=A0A1B6L6N8_9HEMI
MASFPLIEIVKRQAILTFSKLSGVSSNFEENLSKLKSLTNKITSADVNLDSSLLHTIPNGTSEENAPVTYIQVLDDPNLTIGIFVLKPGARLPLHDHPLMYGILKVVHGTVHIQSYSMVADTNGLKEEAIPQGVISVHPEDIALSQDTLYKQVTLLARKEQAVYVNETDVSCVLSPVTGNLHEIHSVDGPAAFVDILAPPYGSDIPGVGPRPCRYFKEIGDVAVEHDEDKRPVKKLIRIPSPPDYWSSSAPYQGP